MDSLKVWHRARELMVAVHKQVVPRLPPEEKWDLAKQIRRSSKSLELEDISKDLYREVRAIADETRRMLNGYIAYLKKW